jgi:tRNA pseudouridine38-40 synthase
VTANAFLQHMVRNIMGTIATVGLGEEGVEWITEVLESRDRKAGGIAAPAHGLTLAGVEYPAAFGVPAAGCSQAIRI